MYRTLITFCCVCLVSAPIIAEDWPHWRGGSRNDVVDESSLCSNGNWLTDSALWKGNVGEGGTSPIVVGDRIFVMGWRSGQDVVSSLDSKTGKELWSVSYECPRYGRHATGDEGLYSGPTSTPEYDIATGLLYTLSCDGDLICWDTNKQGARLWSVNLIEGYQIGRRPKIGRSGLRDYGYTTAPLVHADWVLVEAGANEGTVMAFDKQTGKHVWSSQATGPAGHSGGLVPINVESVPCVAVMTCYGLLVTRIDAESAGKTVAEYEWTTDFINNIATPAVYENFVIITSAYNHNAICKLEITLSGARKIWEQPFTSKVCSPVIHKSHVYWAWRQLRCLDLNTGEQQWQGGSFGEAGSCIATNDDRLIVWGGRGRLTLAETAVRSPREYKELATFDQRARSDVWPHVVLSGGRIFCKDRDGNLSCFSPDQRAINGSP